MKLKGIPIGISDFKKMIEENCYYFDKTKFIEDVIKDSAEIKLFTRPRRFGKTLNMSMFKYFFDVKNADENRKLFKDLYIEKSEIFKYQGQNPVIFLSLKDLKFRTFKEMENYFRKLIIEAFGDYRFIREKLDELELNIFNKILKNEDVEDFKDSLKILSKCLYEYYNQKTVLIIDEYDTPIVAAYEYGYYDEAISFFRVFYASALKDNTFLQMGLMTGILRVAKEGIFSGLNNLLVDSILDKNYSEYFGLTESEIKEALRYYEIEYKLADVKDWYDGYKFGNSEIYNPWSIINYIRNKNLEPYWINTSDNYLIKNLLSTADEEIFEDLKTLFNYQTIEKNISKNSTLVNLRSKKDLWQLLFFSGYLTIDRKVENTMSSYFLRIVNKEIHSFFRSSFIEDFSIKESVFYNMMQSFLKKDFKNYEKHLQSLMLTSFSYFDAAQEEKFYHNFILGMILSLDKQFYVSSNAESGLGRYDIILEPKNVDNTAFIMEFKVAKNEEDLEKECDLALEQIKEKAYDTELRKRGINDIAEIAVTFYGKKVRVKVSS